MLDEADTSVGLPTNHAPDTLACLLLPKCLRLTAQSSWCQPLMPQPSLPQASYPALTPSMLGLSPLCKWSTELYGRHTSCCKPPDPASFWVERGRGGGVTRGHAHSNSGIKRGPAGGGERVRRCKCSMASELGLPQGGSEALCQLGHRQRMCCSSSGKHCNLGGALSHKRGSVQQQGRGPRYSVHWPTAG
jgi:hypothetical protein